jgi:hypothetical protein
LAEIGACCLDVANFTPAVADTQSLMGAPCNREIVLSLLACAWLTASATAQDAHPFDALTSAERPQPAVAEATPAPEAEAPLLPRRRLL